MSEELQKKLEASQKEFQRLYDSHLFLNKENEILKQVNHLYTQVDHLDANIEALMDLSMTVVPSEAGALLLVDVDSEELYFKEVRGPKAKEVEKFRIPVHAGIAGHSFTEMQTISVSDVSKDPRHYQEISEKVGFETRSIIAVPIHFAGETFGVIEIINKKEGDTFVTNEIEMLELIAKTAGSLIHLAIRLNFDEKGE